MKFPTYIGRPALLTLIGLNCLLFIVMIAGSLTGHHGVAEALVLSPSPTALLSRPWTFITYAFAQVDVLHLVFNMLWFYAFGSLLLTRRSGRDLTLLYLTGAIIGAIIFLIFASQTGGPLVGSSAAVISVAVAVAFIMPDTELYVPLIGMTRIKWIVAVVTVLFLIGLSAPNAGGNLAHLGGVVTGAVGGMMIRRKSGIRKATPAQAAEYESLKTRIRQSGYESLTSKEKRRFFELSSTRK